MKYVKFLVVPLLYVALAFMIIGGMPPPDAGGGNVAAGDANGDGFVNGLDIAPIINFFLNDTPIPGNGDCNGDGSVNGLDIGCVINIFLGGDGQQLQINSLSTTSASPGSLLKITGSGFDPNAELIIRFFDGEDFIVDMLVIEAITTAVTSSVPPFFNLTTGEFATGTVDVQVVQKSGATTRTSNVITGFQIQVPPTSPLPLGTLTLGYLRGALFEANQQSIAIIGTRLDTPEVNSALAGQISSLNFLISAFESVVNNPGTSVTIGTIDGIPNTIDSVELLNSDRLILALLTVQASFVSANGTTSLLPSSSVTLGQTGSVPPQAQSAEEILDSIENEMLLETDWDEYHSSVRNASGPMDIPILAEYSLIPLGLSAGILGGVILAGVPAGAAGVILIGGGLAIIGIGLALTDDATFEFFSDLTSKVATSVAKSLSEFNERVVGALKEIIESSTETITEVVPEFTSPFPTPPPTEPPATQPPSGCSEGTQECQGCCLPTPVNFPSCCPGSQLLCSNCECVDDRSECADAFINLSCGSGKTCTAGDCGVDDEALPIQCTSCDCFDFGTPEFHCHCQPGDKEI